MAKYTAADIERFATVFKALSNPHRLRIFLRLASCRAPAAACGPEEAPQCVGVVGEDLGVAPSTLSHHIKELRQAGVIQVQRCGQYIHCWVDPELARELREFVEAALAS
jgi:ArsR family transcriptional regulator